jgi:Asp-tRNA(Asn)/Glu-tRNA(Gln) amidotransferase B subunit
MAYIVNLSSSSATPSWSITPSVSTPFTITDTTYVVESPYKLLSTTPPNVASLNLSYSKPTLSIYSDLNADPDVQHRIVKFVQMKTLDHWLYRDLAPLLGYFKVDSSGKVSVITKKEDYNPKSIKDDSDEIIEKKIDFIEENLLTRKTVKKILDRYVSDTNGEWVKIPKRPEVIKILIGEKLKKMIKQCIAESKRK